MSTEVRQTDGLIYRQTDGQQRWKDGWTAMKNRRIGRWIDRRMDRQMDRLVQKQMNRGMGRQMKKE
jgi:hypothetical protein